MFRRLLHERSLSLLPPFVESQNDITNISLRLRNDAAPALDFRVEWDAKDCYVMEKWKKLRGKKEKKKEKKQESTLRCHGPCGQDLQPDLLHHFGFCEHNVCLQCLARAPRDPVFGTAPTCPNVKCLDHDVKQPVTDESRASVLTDDVFTNTRSTVSHVGTKELILCSVVLFEKKGDKVKREKITEEWYSTTPIDEVRRRCAGHSKKEITSLLFVPSTNYIRSQLKPLPKDAKTLADLIGSAYACVFFAGFGVEL